MRQWNYFLERAIPLSLSIWKDTWPCRPGRLSFPFFSPRCCDLDWSALPRICTIVGRVQSPEAMVSAEHYSAHNEVVVADGMGMGQSAVPLVVCWWCGWVLLEKWSSYSLMSRMCQICSFGSALLPQKHPRSSSGGEGCRCHYY